ncbi:MAG: glucose-1-phosphate thymidylyltransferase RfbA [Steroidobacteraceae bacterium]
MIQSRRKGIVLAGGAGTRLHPITLGVSKQLLPIYDKPMIYYPLSVLMLAGIREVMIISTPQEQFFFQRLLGDGERWGMRFEYAVQPRPDGLPQALAIAREFLEGGPSCLVLGDNIFYGQGFTPMLRRADARESGATIFGYRVRDPGGFGVVELRSDGRIASLEEKPASPKSNLAVTGLYFFDEHAPGQVARLRPSSRGETEIIDLLRLYLDEGKLHFQPLGRGFAWLDTGTHESMLQASQFVQTIEQRQGLRISCPEEIAWLNGWIDDARLIELAQPLEKSGYGSYLLGLL